MIVMEDDAGTPWGPTAALLSAALRPSTLGEAAVQKIYGDIVTGALPPGAKLRPDELKVRYGVGTSPIREALIRLSAEGLVEALGQRGFRVPRVSEAELEDIAQVRTTLSGLALRQAIERGNEEWEASVVAAFHRMERLVDRLKADPARHLAEWEARNQAFHQALEAACGSPWLLHFASVAYSQSERYRRRFVDYPTLLPRAQDEHRAIMEAALRRDADRAVAHLEAHILRGMTIVRERLRVAHAHGARTTSLPDDES